MAAAVLLAGAVVLWWAQAGAGSGTSPSPVVLPVPTAAGVSPSPAQQTALGQASPGTETSQQTARLPSSIAPSADLAPAQRAAPSPAPPAVAWQAVLADLEVLRSEAFRTGDGSLLGEVYAAGSTPMARDLELLAELDRQGLHAQDLRLVIDDVAVVAMEPTRTTLRVSDRLPAYAVVGADGEIVEQVPARGPVTWLLTMTPSAQGWRISEVVRS